MRTNSLIASLLFLSLAAATTLAQSPDLDPDLEYLLRSLIDPDRAVQTDAMADLKDMGERAVGPLIEIIQGKRPGPRPVVAGLLGEIGDPRAVEPLMVMLNEEKEGALRYSAALALGELGDGRAIESLMRAASPNVGIDEVRFAALDALGELGDPHAVEFLMAIVVTDMNPLAQDHAAAALDKMMGTRFKHDNRKRAEWIKSNHPEWLDLGTGQKVPRGASRTFLIMGGGLVLLLLAAAWIWKAFISPG